MKLFVVAALIAVAAAARLDNLERGYLPPNGQGQVANDNSPNGQPGQAGVKGPSGGIAEAATTNQYLPPTQGPAGSNLAGDASAQQPNQFEAAANGAAQSPGAARPDSQYQPQPAGQTASTAADNFQNIPQQEFDEQTGYKY